MGTGYLCALPLVVLGSWGPFSLPWAGSLFAESNARVGCEAPPPNSVLRNALGQGQKVF